MATESTSTKGDAATDLELWASKSLDLAWLPRCDNRHLPSLHEVAQSGPARDNPIRSGVLRWFWRVDLVFVTWATRAIHRAGTAGALLPAETHSAFRVIRSYITELRPGCWEGIEAKSLSPVQLPGSEIIGRAAVLAKYGLGPRWEGWEKFVPDEEDESTQPTRQAKPTARPSRTSNPDLFD